MQVTNGSSTEDVHYIEAASFVASYKYDLETFNVASETQIMRVSLTVGKVDAGVAVLLTDDKRLVRLLRASNCVMSNESDRSNFPLYYSLRTFTQAASST